MKDAALLLLAAPLLATLTACAVIVLFVGLSVALVTPDA